MAKLAIEAGHGIGTPGKRIPKALDPKETREWSLNERIVRYTIEELKGYEGLQILRLDDPTGKIDVPLPERTTKANNWGADLLISIHCNAYLGKPWDGGGIAVYVHPKASKTSFEVQKKLYDELIKQTGLKGNRATGVPTANFHMVRESKMPAVLSENGFMDSRVDYKIILTDDFARKVARAHANVVISHFNLKKKEGGVTKPITPAPEQVLYRVQVGAYKVLTNAKAMETRLKKDGYATYMIKTTGGLYRVQTGAFAVKDNAIKLERELKVKGYATYLTTNAVNDAGPVEKVEETPKPTTPTPKKIAEDGYFGPATAKLAQEVYKMKVVDGIISGQPRNESTQNISAAEFGKGGSSLICEMQREFRVPTNMQDGQISRDSRLVRKMQRHYGTVQDGKISSPSMVIRKWQEALNKGKRK